MSIKRHKNTILSLLALALVMAFPVGSGFYQRRKLALPSHVQTLAEFSANMARPEGVVMFEKDGLLYVEVIGGPPRYFCSARPIRPARLYL